jgi:ATP-dependent DNA helicase RecG
MNQQELMLILQEGEGYKIEFKEKLANIDKEIVAFANSSGGTTRLKFKLRSNQ